MIKTGEEIDRKLRSDFGITDFLTLSKHEKAVRYYLNNDAKGDARALKAQRLALNYIESKFSKGDIYLRIVLWDLTHDFEIKNPILKPLSGYIIDKKEKDETSILYYYLPKYFRKHVSDLITAVVNYDLGIEPSLEMKCYYLNFAEMKALNVYDDRGLDYVEIS